MNEVEDSDEKKENNMWSFGISPGRIEALCDGVFAIAMTILVLELSLDHEILNAIAREGHYESQYLFDGIYTYLAGFIILGIYWALHHYIFHFIKRTNGVLVWLNVIFLIFAALVPLSVKVNRTYPDSYPGFAFNMFTTVITFLMLLVIWQYATRGYRLVDHDIDKHNISIIKYIIINGSIIAIIVTIITYFISWVGWFAFVPMIYVIISIAYGHHKPFLNSRSK